MFKFKKTIAFLSLTFLLLNFFGFSSAANAATNLIIDRDYFYLETAVGVDVYSNLYISFKSYNQKQKKFETTNYSLHGSGDINLDLALGFYSATSGSSLEVEFGQHNLNEKDITIRKVEKGTTTSHKVTTSDMGQSMSTMDYLVVNWRKNIVHFRGSNSLIYFKAGLGAGMINNINLEEGAMNVPTPVLNFALGYTYRMLEHMDFYTSYNVKLNLPTRVQVSSGIRQIYFAMPQTIFVGLRLKV